MQQEAGAIIAHYFKQLAEREGLRWTAANDRDMQRLSALLGSPAEEVADSIPPYQAERTTVVLARDDAPLADPRFEAWKRQRDEDEAAVGRMVSRNGGGR